MLFVPLVDEDDARERAFACSRVIPVATPPFQKVSNSRACGDPTQKTTHPFYGLLHRDNGWRWKKIPWIEWKHSIDY